MKRVAVIIAAYAAERWIVDCVRSVLHQKPTAGWTYELRIGVDACPATSAALEAAGIPHYVARENSGAYVVRNSLIGLAPPANAYAIFDADDVMLPEYLHTLLAVSEGTAIAGGARVQVTERLSPVSQAAQRFQNGVCLIPASAWSALGGYRADRMASDDDLIHRARALGLPVCPHDAPLYLRRVHAESLTQAKGTALGSAARQAVRAEHARLRAMGELRVTPRTVPLDAVGDPHAVPNLQPPSVSFHRYRRMSVPVKHVTWGGYIWGPGMGPGRSIEDLKRAQAAHTKPQAAASAQTTTGVPPAAATTNYSRGYTVAQLGELCRERGLTVTPTGKSGRPVARDYIAALEAADASEAA